MSSSSSFETDEQVSRFLRRLETSSDKGTFLIAVAVLFGFCCCLLPLVYWLHQSYCDRDENLDKKLEQFESTERTTTMMDVVEMAPPPPRREHKKSKKSKKSKKHHHHKRDYDVEAPRSKRKG